MDEKQVPEKKNLKPVLIIVSIAIAAAAVFFIVISLMGDSDTGKHRIKSGEILTTAENEQSVSNTTAEVTDNMTNIEEIGDMAVCRIALEYMGDKASKANTADGTYIDKSNNTVNSGKLEAGENSVLIKNAKALNRWTASSVISSVTAEKIKVKLPVYDKQNKKTQETKDGLLYAALIETKPPRISFASAGQMVKSPLSDALSIVKGYETEEGQEVLFACSNEFCARDMDNPNNNVFLNDDASAVGTVIKNSVIAQASKSSLKSYAFLRDGTWKYPKSVSMSSSNELIRSGVIATNSFTYPVIMNSKKYYFPESRQETGVWTDHIIGKGVTKTLIGRISSDKYVVLISDGFGFGYLSEYMLNEFGAEDAYWGNGGTGAAMYIKGYGVITPYDYPHIGDMMIIK